MTFLQAVNAIGEHKKVQCTMPGKYGGKVVYEVRYDPETWENELFVDGKRKNIDDFCFAPAQVLWGKWRDMG